MSQPEGGRAKGKGFTATAPHGRTDGRTGGRASQGRRADMEGRAGDDGIIWVVISILTHVDVDKGEGD